jgi:hypothetical protein
MGVGSVVRSGLTLLAVGWVSGVVPGAHVDLSDLTPVGQLASFGLLDGEGPGAKLDTA